MCGNDVSGVQASLATEQMATPTGLMRGAEAMQQELIEHLRHATIGEYEILGELGRGGMATVYLAHEIALDRKVAIKVMSPALVQGDGMIERFKREARTAASLSHPNIIPVYAVRETDRLLYFVMKFVQGRPLDSIIKEVGPLPIPMVKAILAQAGSAFGYAHRRGIVHRDIKPANIMIDDEGWAVVTDFGIAKVSEREGLTMTGMTVGTPTYMSPEQCMAQDVTGASDQYSLGVVGYEMITGRPPFTGGSMMTIMYGHFNEVPPAIPPLRPDCPPDLQAAIMRMLEKDPTKRWPSVDDSIVAVGAQTLSHDDPTRTQLVSLAKEGAAKTQALIGKMSVPLSPIPGSRSRPGVTAQTASGAKTAVAAAAQPRGPRPVPAPARSGNKGVMIGALVAVLVIGGGLAVLKPWQRPAPVEQAPAQPVSSEPAASTTAAPNTPTTTAAENPSAEPATTPSSSAPPPQSEPAAANPTPATPDAGTKAPNPRQLAKDRSAYNDMVSNVESARRQASAAGATAADLSGGDIMVKNASALAKAQRYSDAMNPLADASSAYVAAMSTARQRTDAAALALQQQQARQQQATPPVTQSPAQSSPAPITPAEPAVDDRGAIQLVVSEYFRAVAAGNVDRMKKLFPSMPTDMQGTYAELFKSGSSIDTSKWEVIGTELAGNKAQVQLDGETVLRDKKGKQLSRSPAPKSLSMEKVGGSWRIADVHQ